MASVKNIRFSNSRMSTRDFMDEVESDAEADLQEDLKVGRCLEGDTLENRMAYDCDYFESMIGYDDMSNSRSYAGEFGDYYSDYRIG